MQYFWWGCRRNFKLITLGSERVNCDCWPAYSNSHRVSYKIRTCSLSKSAHESLGSSESDAHALPCAPMRSHPRFTATLGAGKTRTLRCGNIAGVIMYLKCWLVTNVATRATFVVDSNFVTWTQKMFLKHSLCLSARRATMLPPRFATGGQHRRSQCWRYNVSPFHPRP